MTPLMIAIVIAAAVGALVYVVASTSIEKADVRDSLRRLEGYQIQDVRNQEMLAPISERVFEPLSEGVTQLAQRFTPEGYRDRLRTLHEQITGDGVFVSTAQRAGRGPSPALRAFGGANGQLAWLTVLML